MAFSERWGTERKPLIGYGSLGNAKQYVSAYVAGTAPDVRRYPVSITVTTGTQVDVAYPAEAWMTAEDVAEYFNNTIKPELEESLQDLIDDHNEDPDAHGGALANKQDQIKVEGLLKGKKDNHRGGRQVQRGKGNGGHGLPGAHQRPDAGKQSMNTQDFIPFYDVSTGQHRRATLQALKEAIGVQSPTISVTTCAGASVTCSDGGETTLQGTGSTEFELPHVGAWTVTASLNGESVSQEVEVGGGLLHEVDLMITSGIAVTTRTDKNHLFHRRELQPGGHGGDSDFLRTTPPKNVTDDCTFSPRSWHREPSLSL